MSGRRSPHFFGGLALSLLGLAALPCGSRLAGAQEPRKGDEKTAEKPGAKAAEKPAEKPAAKAKAKPASAFEWLSLELGLVQVRKKYLPALVLYDAPANPASADAPSFLDEHLADSAVKEILKHFVLIRVSEDDLKRAYPSPAPPADPKQKSEKEVAGGKGDGKAGGKNKKAKDAKESARDDAGADDGAGRGPGPGQGPGRGNGGGGQGPGQGQAAEGGAAAAGDAGLEATVGARFGLGGERSAVVVLSYWEEVVKSYVGELPTRTKLKAELTRIWKVNKIYADQARKVEPDLEKSKYADRLNNQRDAVLRVRAYEDSKAQNLMDPVLKKKVNDLIQDYRAKARKAMGEADKLEAAKKYAEAITAFDKVMADFPFQDIMQQANKRKNECLRKLTLGV